MKRKQALILRYSVFGVICVAACVAAAMTLLDRDAAIPDEGLVPGLTDALEREVPTDAPALRFTRVPLPFVHFAGRRSHRLPEDMGSGVVLEDLDGDGLLDIFLVNAGRLGEEPPACALFRNKGDFRFEAVAIDEFMPRVMGLGVSACDYDADGDMDLYVTGYHRNVLLRNDGSMRFRDVTRERGVAGAGFSTGSCWGDADGDGDMDLYVCRYVTFDESRPVKQSRRGSQGLPVTLNPSAFPAEANLLFLNPGHDGAPFREAAAEMGVDNPGGKSLGAVFADLSDDGVVDLYVANDVSDNALFRGRRGQPFEDVTHPSCTADWRGAMGLAVGDPDGDTDLDLFITHWLPEENTLYVKEAGRLFFSDAAAATLLGPPSRGLVGWACDFSDLDNDGRADLVVVNGSTFEQKGAPEQLEPMVVQLFWNGGGQFFDLATGAGPALQQPIVGRGGSAGDIDGDGDIDLIIVAHGEAPLLLRNDTETGHGHVFVSVRGSRPNVFGYGAKVTVEAGGRKQLQQVGTKVSYLSSGPHVLHFGIGRAQDATIRVRFPSGREVVRRGVRAGTTTVVKEVDPRTLGALMDQARDGGEAEAYRRVLDQDPLHPNAMYALAGLVDAGRALQLCEQLIRVEPRVARAYLLKARILSDPARPQVMDLDAALDAVASARRLNRDETGGMIERGRILLLRGDAKGAAEVLELAKQNPRAAALAALSRFRNGESGKARRLLALHNKKEAMNIAEEGDTANRRMGARDLLAQILDLPVVVMQPIAAPESPEVVRPTRYVFADIARWVVAPPTSCTAPPPGVTATCRADIDGDGDEDLVVAMGCDPAAPLPWFVLRREGDHYLPVRGALPLPGFFVRAIAVQAGRVVLCGAGDTCFVAPR